MPPKILYEGSNLKPFRNPVMILMMVLSLGIFMLLILWLSRRFPRKVWVQDGKFYGDNSFLTEGHDPAQMGYHYTIMTLLFVPLGRYIVIAVPKDKNIPIDYSTAREFRKTAKVTGLCNQAYIPKESFFTLLRYVGESGMKPIPKGYVIT